jgi:hypothetical protein
LIAVPSSKTARERSVARRRPPETPRHASTAQRLADGLADGASPALVSKPACEYPFRGRKSGETRKRPRLTHEVMPDEPSALPVDLDLRRPRQMELTRRALANPDTRARPVTSHFEPRPTLQVEIPNTECSTRPSAAGPPTNRVGRSSRHDPSCH